VAVLSKKRPAKSGEKGRSRRAWPFGRGRSRGQLALEFGEFEGLPELEAANDGPRFETLGQELRAARHDQGLTLEELSEITRVRKSHLDALEEGRLEELPSRPFTIGYIRAYAQALGLDGDSAVERFKAEEPVLDEPLHNPIGVSDEKDPRVAAFVVGAIVIIAAIMVWNIAQRAMMAAVPAPPRAADDRAARILATAKPAPIILGKPLPAPVESTTPPPYETPGLAEALGLKSEGGGESAAAKPVEDPLAALASLPQTFAPAGKVYEAGPKQGSVVTLQAVKPGQVIARGADGSVYFARQLAVGDAYRVPAVAGLTLDVSDPKAFQVFVRNQSRGLLPAQQVLADKLVTPPPGAVPVPAPARAAAPAPAPAPAAKPPAAPPPA
jgi:cytoskeletal protein RodZ